MFAASLLGRTLANQAIEDRRRAQTTATGAYGHTRQREPLSPTTLQLQAHDRHRERRRHRSETTSTAPGQRLEPFAPPSPRHQSAGSRDRPAISTSSSSVDELFGMGELRPGSVTVSQQQRRRSDTTGSRRASYGESDRRTRRRHLIDDDVVDESIVPPPAYAEESHENHAPKVAAKAVKDHEKQMQQALKEAELARIAKQKIQPLLPELYRQLESALFHPDIKNKKVVLDGNYIDIKFKLKGVDPKMLERYMPKMFAAYAKQVEIAGIRESRDRALHGGSSTTLDEASLHARLVSQAAQAMVDRQNAGQIVDPPAWNAIQSTDPTEPPMSYEEAERQFGSPSALTRASTNETALPAPTSLPTDRPHSLDIQDAHARQTTSYISGHRIKASRISVERSYYNACTQKIYFSRRYAAMWRKQPATGRRDSLPSAIAMLIVGIKVGLPLFDVITFTMFDLPRMVMQGITHEHTMSIRR